MNNCDNFFMDIIAFLNNNSGIAVLVSSVSVFVAAISLVVAFISNYRTKKQYVISQEPQLTLRLERFDHDLYLLVQNTGRTAAQNISIAVEKIEYNNDQEADVDKMLENFELYPNEQIQARIATSVETILSGRLCPQALLRVSYSLFLTKRKREYTRTISFSKAFGEKVLADVNIDLKTIEGALRAIARAEVRTANYLDGNHAASFDELDIMANTSLQNDLYATFRDGVKLEIKDRNQTNNACFNKK